MDKLGTTDADETPSIGKSVLFAGIFGVVFLGPILSALVYPLSSLESFFTPIEWM
ncbi:hypothetical protein SAMN04487967_3012 [Natronorubrum sediminis]|uniref:Uncharacterized protein n=1 Tax=Natronorubrum sediminis TaxID=640943 RepID=A0A1H6G5J8_9EURY|nr:hypothetical protein SAMN04487967_3012 [Natronorubrum sediminis]